MVFIYCFINAMRWYRYKSEEQWLILISRTLRLKKSWRYNLAYEMERNKKIRSLITRPDHCYPGRWVGSKCPENISSRGYSTGTKALDEDKNQLLITPIPNLSAFRDLGMGQCRRTDSFLC